MIIATLDTAHFSFIATGSTLDEAKRAMRRTWAAHRREYRSADDFASVADSVQYTDDAEVGSGFRDGTLISGTPVLPQTLAGAERSFRCAVCEAEIDRDRPYDNAVHEVDGVLRAAAVCGSCIAGNDENELANNMGVFLR